MSILANEYFDLENEIRFSPGIHNLGEQMARLTFYLNNKDKINNNSLLLTYEELYFKNRDKSTNSKKGSIISSSKNGENSNKSISKFNLKHRNSKNGSFIIRQYSPKKNNSSNLISSKFASQFIKNKNNYNKNNENNNNLEEKIQRISKEKKSKVKMRKNNYNNKAEKKYINNFKNIRNYF